jgi:hypothetical protein
MSLLTQLEQDHQTLDAQIRVTRRTIKANETLLTDCLIALEKGKSHITYDHVERVIQSQRQLLVSIS